MQTFTRVGRYLFANLGNPQATTVSRIRAKT
jgi:hypothetical protein